MTHLEHSFQPYPEYNDSGVAWLGEIPAHWKMLRAKRLFQKMSRPVRAGDEVVTCFRDGIVTLRKNRRLTGFTESLQEIGYQGIRRGDLVIHAMDAFAGAIGVSDSDGKGTPVYAVCKPAEEANSYYYAYIIREMARSQWLLALARGIRERSTDFRFEGFASQSVPVPLLDEQQAIVRFIDHIDHRVNRFIRAKRRLITLLNEQKQAIIHHAVTRGLDPHVRLKPSGVEWLGDVPEGWTLRRLKQLLAQPLKYGANEAAEHTNRDEPRYIRITDIDTNGKLIDANFRSLPQDVAEPYLLKDSDILLARSGATVGKAFLYSESDGIAAYAGYLIRARARSNLINPQYLYTFLQSPIYKRWVSSVTIQATIQNVSAEKYANLVIPVPPLEEQNSIVVAIANESSGYDIAISQTQREIDLIREYRTRLIADVVTGKLDVRGVVLSDDLPIDSPMLSADELADDDDIDLAEEPANADD